MPVASRMGLTCCVLLAYFGMSRDAICSRGFEASVTGENARKDRKRGLST